MENNVNQYIGNTPFINFFDKILNFNLMWFHKEWIDFLESNKYTLILAPRGSGKSTVAAVYCIYKLLTESDYKILIISNTGSRAKNLKRIIKNYLENSEIKDIFKNLHITSCGSKKFKISNGNGKDCSITCDSVGAKSNDSFDCIILDDIVDECNSENFNKNKLLDWYKNILVLLLKKTGELHIIGSRYYYDDIYTEIESEPLFNTRIYRAETEGRSLWPNKFDMSSLKLKEKQIGNEIYNMQYLNNIIG